MHSRSRKLLSLAALGIGLLGFAAQPSRADLFVDVLVGNVSILGPIQDGGPNDLNMAAGAITVDIGALNAALAGFNIPLEFDSVEASSNELTAPFTNTPATLTQSGAVRYTSTAGGPALITVQASDHDYNHPNLPIKFLDSSASATFTNVVAGNLDAFQSFFDPTNTPHFVQAIPSPISLLLPTLARNPSSDANTAATTPLGVQPIPFALTNQSNLILGPSVTLDNQAKISFGGSTRVTAVVPEPASMVLLLLGVPVVGFVRARNRRAAA